MRNLRVLWILTIALFCLDPVFGELWCYECNLNLTDGFNNDCHDPYHPAPSDNLNACPTDEPHDCLKSTIFYDNLVVTVRGCVPSRMTKKYCDVDRAVFPLALVECWFCNDYACNRSTSVARSFIGLVTASVTLVTLNSLRCIRSA